MIKLATLEGSSIPAVFGKKNPTVDLRQWDLIMQSIEYVTGGYLFSAEGSGIGGAGFTKVSSATPVLFLTSFKAISNIGLLLAS